MNIGQEQGPIAQHHTWENKPLQHFSSYTQKSFKSLKKQFCVNGKECGANGEKKVSKENDLHDRLQEFALEVVAKYVEGAITLLFHRCIA